MQGNRVPVASADTSVDDVETAVTRLPVRTCGGSSGWAKPWSFVAFRTI